MRLLAEIFTMSGKGGGGDSASENGKVGDLGKSLHLSPHAALAVAIGIVIFCVAVVIIGFCCAVVRSWRWERNLRAKVHHRDDGGQQDHAGDA